MKNKDKLILNALLSVVQNAIFCAAILKSNLNKVFLIPLSCFYIAMILTIFITIINLLKVFDIKVVRGEKRTKKDRFLILVFSFLYHGFSNYMVYNNMSPTFFAITVLITAFCLGGWLKIK